jgi:hypothetical protein
MFPVICILGFLSLGLGSIFLTLFRSWPRTLSAFAIQSFGVGAVALQVAPLPVAAAKVLVGWLIASMIAVTLCREKREFPPEDASPLASIFRLSLLLFMFSSIVALIPDVKALFQDPPAGIVFPACFLLGNGFINLGLSEHPMRVGISLISLVQGFELAYLWMEQSLLVVGLLAVMDLAIILVLVYQFSASLSAISEERVA